MSEFLGSILFILLVVVFISVWDDREYYKKCTDGGTSYAVCAYDRLFNPNREHLAK